MWQKLELHSLLEVYGTADSQKPAQSAKILKRNLALAARFLRKITSERNESQGCGFPLSSLQRLRLAGFKLKSGEMTVHSMAFSFPRRNPKALFFPTVHIHVGKVHSEAEFANVLYCQPHDHEPLRVRDWREFPDNAGRFMKVDKSKGLISPEQHCC